MTDDITRSQRSQPCPVCGEALKIQVETDRGTETPGVRAWPTDEADAHLAACEAEAGAAESALVDETATDAA